MKIAQQGDRATGRRLASVVLCSGALVVACGAARARDDAVAGLGVEQPVLIAQAQSKPQTRESLFGDDLPKDTKPAPATDSPLGADKEKPAGSRESLFGDDLPKGKGSAEQPKQGAGSTSEAGSASGWRQTAGSRGAGVPPSV